MVSSKLVDLDESSVAEDDLLVPDIIFADGEEAVSVRVLTYQSSRAINFVLNALDEDEIQTIRLTVFGKLVEIA